VGWTSQITRKGLSVISSTHFTVPIRLPPRDELIYSRFHKFVLCIRGRIRNHSGRSRRRVRREVLNDRTERATFTIGKPDSKHRKENHSGECGIVMTQRDPDASGLR
jgi:hypothetical protein